MPLYRLAKEVEFDHSLILHADPFARETYAHKLQKTDAQEVAIEQSMKREWDMGGFTPIKPGLHTLRRAGVFRREMRVKVSSDETQAVLLIGEPLTFLGLIQRRNAKANFLAGRVHRAIPIFGEGFTMVGSSFQDFGDGPAFQPVTVLTMRRHGSGMPSVITPQRPAAVA